MKESLTIDVDIEVDFDPDAYVHRFGRVWPKLVMSGPVCVDGRLRVVARIVPFDTPLKPEETETLFDPGGM